MQHIHSAIPAVAKAKHTAAETPAAATTAAVAEQKKEAPPAEEKPSETRKVDEAANVGGHEGETQIMWAFNSIFTV